MQVKKMCNVKRRDFYDVLETKKLRFGCVFKIVDNVEMVSDSRGSEYEIKSFRNKLCSTIKSDIVFNKALNKKIVQATCKDFFLDTTDLVY